MSQKEEDIEAINRMETDKIDEGNLKQTIKDCLLTLNKLNVSTQEQKKSDISYMRMSTENFVRKSSVFINANTFKSLNTINFKIDEVDDKFNNDSDSNSYSDSSDDENLNSDSLNINKRSSINSKNKNNTVDFYCKNVDTNFKDKYSQENEENQEDLP